MQIKRSNVGSVKDLNVVAHYVVAGCGQELLKKKFLPTWLSFPEVFMESISVEGVNYYPVFTFELFHSISFEISKLVNKCTINLSSDRLRTGVMQRGQKLLLKYDFGYSVGAIC